MSTGCGGIDTDQFFRPSAAERQTPKRTNCERVRIAAVAQLVERVLGKDEVMGSIPISSCECGSENEIETAGE